MFKKYRSEVLCNQYLCNSEPSGCFCHISKRLYQEIELKLKYFFALPDAVCNIDTVMNCGISDLFNIL